MYCDSALAYTKARGNDTALRLTEPKEIWRVNETSESKILLINCMTLSKDNDTVNATDCINGTLIDRKLIPFSGRINFTVFWDIYRTSNDSYDKNDTFLPQQSVLTIYNSTMLYINLEKCVNTLRGECKTFNDTYGNDGQNNTQQSRYLCFYSKQHSNFTLFRFDLEKSTQQFLYAVITPTVTFIISFIFLCVITHCVRVGDDAKMRCQYCASSEQNLSEMTKHKCKTEEEPILSDSPVQSPTVRDAKYLLLFWKF